MTFVQPYEPTTKEELEAAAHYAERILQDGRHDVTCCPYPMRAMCRHRKGLESLKANGWVEPPLNELMRELQSETTDEP